MKKQVQLQAIKTDLFTPGQNLAAFIQNQIPQNLVQERMVLAVTSKIVSLAENRLVPRQGIDKTKLVQNEADVYLGEIGYGCHLTVKEGLFIASSGIDESNSEHGDYILYPKDPIASAKALWTQLRTHWNLREFGILLTDSHTSPLRQGVTGICLSYWGFRAVRSLVGTQDLFGRELKMTQMNLADGIASMTVLVMGEGQERQPLAVVNGLDLFFCEESNAAELRIPLKEDLYYPILKSLSKDCQTTLAK